MSRTQIEVSVGKYRFRIIDNTLFYNEQIYSRNMKIGGNHPDCVNISISYNNGIPVAANMPILEYDTECVLNPPMDKGEGTRIMINTILKYLQKELPSIQYVSFDDASAIDCATDEEQNIQAETIIRKKNKTFVRPIPLYYFSIAFNGVTWYEKHFGAVLSKNHVKYQTAVEKMLYDPSSKLPYIKFLQLIKPSENITIELESYYMTTTTYGDFFQSLPKDRRCHLVRDWISIFMEFYLKDNFSNRNWKIQFTKKDDIKSRGGSRYYFPKDVLFYKMNIFSL